MKAVSLWVSLTLMASALGAEGVNLQERYPTTLVAGDTAAAHARPWEFTADDVFSLRRFSFDIGQDLRLEVEAADLGIGHCADGAVWAVVTPREKGFLTSSAATEKEAVRHIWLRFHPREINALFPPEQVLGAGDRQRVPEISAIARVKINASWHAGNKATIPEPKDLTVDVDTQAGKRRFFAVDRQAPPAKYISAFENRSVELPPKLTPTLAETSFDQLWEAYDRQYAMFTLRPEVDWSKLREQHRPRALDAKSAYELADVFVDLLRPLRDLHIWMDVAGAPVPIFNRPREANANPAAWPRLLGKLNQAGRSVQWTKTPEKIGYVVIHQWNDDSIPGQVDEVLEQMRDTRGLIVDVRLNGGGSEPLAQAVASRFLGREFTYAYSQYRSGPQHGDLGPKTLRTLEPRGPWRYHRPVVVLIGQKCMSSNESFIAMMSGGDQVTTMGDATCGSSGNPRTLKLPAGITVSLPRWIDYLPDGSPLDERGFQPKVRFEAKPGAFESERDDLLSAALARLALVPLPEKPIEGPALSATEKPRKPALKKLSMEIDYPAAMAEEAKDPLRPKVISVSPPAGAANVAPTTTLRVRFDRPMDPFSLKLDWAAGGFFSCEQPVYDAEQKEFSLTIHLRDSAVHEVVVNKPMLPHDLPLSRKQFPSEGFRSDDGAQAALFRWSFRTAAGVDGDSNKEASKGDAWQAVTNPREAMEKAKGDPRLLALLESMAQQRKNLTSLVERVQTISLSGEGANFTRFAATSARFLWQHPNRFFADASGPMLSCRIFRIGCDGEQAWWHIEHGEERSLTVCPAPEVQVFNLSFCDPFKLTKLQAREAAAQGLIYRGQTTVEGRPCDQIETWEMPSPEDKTARPEPRSWYIDSESRRPLLITYEFGDRFVYRMHFLYESVNQPIPQDAFSVPQNAQLTRKQVEPLDADYTKRFLNAEDGSAGEMSVRWGKQGPKGRSSSGLN